MWRHGVLVVLLVCWAGLSAVQAQSCGGVLCFPPEEECVYVNGRFQCRLVNAPSCDGVVCPPGQNCVLQQVHCIRAPCPPQPSCD